MVCPYCLKPIEHAGEVTVHVDTALGDNDHRLTAWRCTVCLGIFYTDNR